MNIAFYTPTLQMGGYEKVVVNYANSLQEHHKVTILCGTGGGELAEGIVSNVKVEYLNCRTRTAVFAFTKWLKNNDVDILYVPFITYTAIAVKAKKLAHSNAIIYSAQHGYCDVEVPFLRNRITKLFREADAHIAVSDTIAKFFSEKFSIKRESFYIFDNPVFNSNYIHHNSVQDDKYKLDEPTFVISGRLAKDKHVEIAIRIMFEVNKLQKAHLLILGDGPQRNELENLINELKMEKLVEIKGYVSEPMQYFKDCKALLLTSEVESFGNSVVEALYCGIPAIVTDCGGPIEIIDNNIYGVNIGEYNNPDVIKIGKEAVLKILNCEISFGDFRKRAQKYDAVNLENQFLQPYININEDRTAKREENDEN